jgi:hypothetical protein
MSWLAADSSLTRMPSSFLVIVFPETVESQTPMKCNPPPQSPVSSSSKTGWPEQPVGAPVNTAVALVLLAILLSRMTTSEALTTRTPSQFAFLTVKPEILTWARPALSNPSTKDAVGKPGSVNDGNAYTRTD